MILDRDMERGECVRIAILMAMIGLLLLGLIGSLWSMQVAHGAEFRARADSQSLRRVRVPAMRGRIFDRHGVCLADNRPCYNIALYVEDFRRPGGWSNTVTAIDTMIRTMERSLGTNSAVNRTTIWAHVRRRLPLPLVVWGDVDSNLMARWAERHLDFPGVELDVEPIRSYPHAALAAHVLGYVGRVEPTDDEDFQYYLPEYRGRIGLERSLDELLAGRFGAYQMWVDAAGYRHRMAMAGALQPRDGGDVHLRLDASIQQAIENALEGSNRLANLRGAAVVVDPRNGDVLAMASRPAFPLDAFVPAPSPVLWRALVNDADSPMLNRAISGQYPPGSIFKPLVGVATLESGRMSADQVVDCPGYYTLGSTPVFCWQRAGHGELDLHGAIMNSCNTYFGVAAIRCGPDRIAAWARAFGLGAPTGLGLDGERAGLVPDPAWKRARFNDGWAQGDSFNYGIGQGFLLVTPLQMAMMTATFANGGLLLRPRLVDDGDGAPVMVRRVAWSPETRRVIGDGMRDVVESSFGTGARARVEGWPMAGKTGTAEFGPRAQRRKYTWMIAYAPVDAPRYAAVIVIEEGESGGLTAAPRMQALMRAIHAREWGLPATGEEG